MNKNVVLVYDTPYPFAKGGGERRLFEIGRFLARSGCQVTWLTRDYWGNGSKVFIQNDIKYVAVSRFKIKRGGRRSVYDGAFFYLKLLVTPELKKSDVIIMGSTPFLHYFSLRLNLFFNRSRAPIITDLWEFWGDYWFNYYNPLIAFFGRMIERHVTLFSDWVVTISDFGMKKVENKLNKGSKLSMISNGINYLEINKNISRDKNNDLIYFGRIQQYKNIEMLITAYILLVEQGFTGRLRILGDGNHLEKIKSFSSKYKLKYPIEFYGQINDITEAYHFISKAGVFVQPSLSEGGGSIAVLEALACGTPVVIFDHPQGIDKSLIKNGTLGAVVYTVNAFSLAEGIKDVLKRTIKKDNLSKQCQKFAAQFDWGVTGKKYLNLIKKVSSKKN